MESGNQAFEAEGVVFKRIYKIHKNFENYISRLATVFDFKLMTEKLPYSLKNENY